MATSSVNFNGTISGLDTASLITAMLGTEKAQLSRIATQRTTLTSTQSAYGQLRSVLAALQSRAEAFTITSAAAKRSATSSTASVLTATAANATVPGSYSVVVDHLSTATVATSTGAIGTPLTNIDLTAIMSTLRLPGTVSAGKASVIVDGKILQATIPDPATATLGDTLAPLAAKIQEQIRTNAGEEGAVVTASIVGNKVQLAVTGATGSHTVAFGAGGDTSNVYGVLGLAGLGTVPISNATAIAGRNVLGVTSTTSKLDDAGLTGLTSGAGTLVINGVSVAYNTTTDSLSAVVTRINSAGAGVTASLDRGNDRLVLTSRTGGAAPIVISDNTGTLAAALKLAPGTTAAQVVGRQAQATIDGRVSTSDTNTFSDAITGVTMTVLSEGSSTLTVAPDQSAVSTALSALVSAYNSLADNLDSMTANDPKAKSKGSLAGQPGLRDLALSLRRMLTSRTSLAGSYAALADIGVNTGKPGSVLGTTDRLQLDEAKLASALEKDPTAVADLLNSASGALKSTVTALDGWTTTGGRITKALEGITSQLKALDTQETRVNDRITLKQAALQTKFASMEKTLALLQTTTDSLTQSITQANKSNG